MLTDTYMTDEECDEARRKRFGRDLVELDLSNGPILGNVNLTLKDLNALTLAIDFGDGKGKRVV